MLRRLIKGDNAFVPTTALRVAVRNDMDVAALLLTEQGRVRGDTDIVFHGVPVHSSGAVRLSDGEDGIVWLDIDLAGVEQAVTRVLIVASTEDGVLRDVPGLSVEVFGLDGTTVAGYEVTDAGGETAMVLAELYRRAGGWKFRAVGQGYLDGLVGLAVDHGVDVAEEAPADLPQAPVPIPTLAKIQSPTPLPDPPVADSPSSWTFGTVFAPRTITGRDNDVITAVDLPPGPVMVELAVKGEGHTALQPLDESNEEGDALVNSLEEDFRGRVLASVPGSGRLRLRLKARGSWKARILPLAEARRLTEDRLKGWGPDILLHTGGTADVAFRYQGDSNFAVFIHRLAEHEDATTLPDPGGAVVNEIGGRRETVPLPEGPLLVHLIMADGPWHARLRNAQPHSGWQDVGGVAKLPEPRRARSWLRRDAR